MTQVLDRPTEAEVRTQTEVRPRPYKLDREFGQLPPVGEPPRRGLRWVGWLLGIAVLATFAWLVISEVTSEDAPVATQSIVVPDGAITADPKVRTPVVTSQMVNESIRTGVPGHATLTEVVTLGHGPAESLEDATVNPMIYWAVQPTYASMMEEATVSPIIYEAAARAPTPSIGTALPGALWRHDVVLEERPLLPVILDSTFGMWPSLTTSVVATPTSVPAGAYWRYDVMLEERALLPEMLDLSFGVSFGGRMNIKL